MSERIQVRLTPNAAREELQGWSEGVLRVKVRAPAREGMANRALCALLARETGCRPRAVRILSGESSRLKTVELPRRP